MLISDLSVKRPVLATVMSLALVIIGLLARERLAVREFPQVDPPVISVSTNYRGASSDVIERRITQVLENEIAGIAGVEKLTSTSKDESSQITIEFDLDRNIDAAVNDVRERVSRVIRQMPEEAEPPQILKQGAGMDATMYVDVSSDQRSVMELTDFARRNLVDRLSTLDGVSTIRVSGSRELSVRIWLDRDALAARGLTAQDIEDLLRRENVEVPAGRIESLEREFTLRTDAGLRTPEDFAKLVVANSDGYVTRLGDVADVRIEPENTRRIARSDGIPGLSLGIVPQSQANILAVNQSVLRELERIGKSIPADIAINVNVDFSVFIRESMGEVVKALGFALLVVLVVIFAFLGSVRATLIPAITIPIAIISTFIVMAVMDFSINTLTLLGLVLAIGLVVDDAIVVLENIVRRMEMGEKPLLAAIEGTREIGFAVVATTVVLIAVFIPISFMPGALGQLFGEFGLSLAAAVAFSSFVALTLVPMLASKLFAQGIERKRVSGFIDRAFKWLTRRYEQLLWPVVRRPLISLLVIGLLGTASFAMFDALPAEYAPTEDRGMLFMWMRAPEGASPDYMDKQVRKAEDIAIPYVLRGDARRVLVRTGMGSGGGDANSAFAYMPLMPWSERDVSSMEMAAELRGQLSELPGMLAMVMLPPSLNVRSSGQPLTVVLGGTNYADLAEWSELVMARARENSGIVGLRSDWFERKPKIDVRVDRDRAADLGVSLSAVGRTLETMLGSRVVTTFEDRGEEYNVLLQARPEDRATPGDLANIYVRSERSGELVPLASVVELTETSGPVELKRFDRLRSISMTSSLAPGYSLGEALAYMEKIIGEEIPEGVTINYDGESREFKQSGSSIYFTFALALVLAFLVLAAQFESFRHPLIIMFTVPLALFGGLIGLNVMDSSINVFSQIGAIMLIGLAAKNGILIVEFANQLRDRGTEFLDATVEAATVRLRPVVMTSLCTAGGAIPLLLAFGAGAESRRTIGAVVFFGVTISVFLTLFLIPAMYALLARGTKSPEYIAQQVEVLRQNAAKVTKS
jgi:multidrug efflux pump